MFFILNIFIYFHSIFVYERIIIVNYLRKLDIVTSGVVIAAFRFCHLTMSSTAHTSRSASSVFSLPWIQPEIGVHWGKPYIISSLRMEMVLLYIEMPPPAHTIKKSPPMLSAPISNSCSCIWLQRVRKAFP